MAKVYTITTILVGFIFLLTLAGVSTFSSSVYQAIFGGGTDPLSGELAGQILFSVLVGTGVAIVVGYFTRQSSESFLLTGISSLLFTWTIGDLFSIARIDTGDLWINSIIRFIMYPVIAGYFIAILQWWRGNDIL